MVIISVKIIAHFVLIDHLQPYAMEVWSFVTPYYTQYNMLVRQQVAIFEGNKLSKMYGKRCYKNLQLAKQRNQATKSISPFRKQSLI